jgi:ParB-like chromosome segregation protein Spo0J
MTSAHHDFVTVQKPVSWLKPNPRNARTHSDAQIAKLATLISVFGWRSPILADEAGNILAGHGRLKAALLIGLDTVPVCIADGWTEEQKAQFALADNRIALESGWDDELLAIELGDLQAAGADMALTGFDDGEVAALLGPGDAEIGAAKIQRVETSTVNDTFWVQISGPLAEQADILVLLRAVVDGHPLVTLRMGTTAADG